MTHEPEREHLSDEVLSALIDDRLTPGEERVARAHLEVCSACPERLADFRSVVGLLRALPSIDPPREFVLGPRLVADPPNVVRLRRWYTFARAGAATLAAAFVFLSVGTLYVDSQPKAPTAALSARVPEREAAGAAAPAQPSAPTPAARAAAPAAQGAAAPQPPGAPAQSQPAQPAPAAQQVPPQQPGAQAAPAAQPQPALAPATGPALRLQAAATPTPAAEGGAADQVAAATSVRALPPTPVPTVVPTQAPQVAIAKALTETQSDPAAALRIAAVIVGVLAALGILAALFIRHRLRAASILVTE